jgi:hypothetical protein
MLTQKYPLFDGLTGVAPSATVNVVFMLVTNSGSSKSNLEKNFKKYSSAYLACYSKNGPGVAVTVTFSPTWACLTEREVEDQCGQTFLGKKLPKMEPRQTFLPKALFRNIGIILSKNLVLAKVYFGRFSMKSK